MPQECIFCKIINGEQESEIVYENENTIAILDIRPSTPGHTLVIPKNHSTAIEGLSEEEISSVFTAVREVIKMIGEGLNADGFNVGWNHGKVAGQAVPHLHVHVLPRFEGDKGGPIQALVRNETEESVGSIARKIRSGGKAPKDTSRVRREAKKEAREEQEKNSKEREEDEETEEEEGEEEKEKEEEHDMHSNADLRWKQMKKPNRRV